MKFHLQIFTVLLSEGMGLKSRQPDYSSSKSEKVHLMVERETKCLGGTSVVLSCVLETYNRFMGLGVHQEGKLAEGSWSKPSPGGPPTGEG